MDTKDQPEVKEIYPVQSWSLDGSRGIDTMATDRIRNISDSDERYHEILRLQRIFEKKYGLNSTDSAVHILMVGGDSSGCGFVRVEKPSKFLNREQDIIAFPTLKITPELLQWAHVIVWQRQYRHDLAPLRDIMKKLKKPQIFDIDDLLHEIPLSNPASKTFYRGSDACDMTLEWMKECDLITVTRPELGEYYKEMTGTPYHVLPNCIDFETFPAREVKKNTDGVIRIGWIGSGTHYDDLKVASYGISRVLAKYGDRVKLVLMGFDGVQREQRTVDGKQTTVAIGDALDSVPREFHKFVDVQSYYQALCDLDLDIGIIPLERNKFNDIGKSNIKFLEMSAAKIPCVVSKTPVYADVVNGETGLVAKRDADFERHLESLIESSDLRERIAENAHAYVKNNFNFSMKIQLWANLYREVFLKRLKEVSGESTHTPC